MAAMSASDAAAVTRRLTMEALEGSMLGCDTIIKLNHQYERLQVTSLKGEEQREYINRLTVLYKQKYRAIGARLAEDLADELAHLVQEMFGHQERHHDTDEEIARKTADIIRQLRQRLDLLAVHRDFKDDPHVAQLQSDMRDKLNRVVVVEMDSGDDSDSSSSDTSVPRPTYRTRATFDDPAPPSNNAPSRLDELREGVHVRAQNIVHGRIDPHRPRYDASAWRKRCSEAYELTVERFKHSEVTIEQAHHALEKKRQTLGAEAHTAWRPRQASESRQLLEEAINGAEDAHAHAVRCLQVLEKRQRDRQVLRTAVEAYRDAFKNEDAYVDDLTSSLRQNVNQMQRLTHARGQPDSIDWHNEVLTAFATVFSDCYEALGCWSVSAWTEQYLNTITDGLRRGQSCQATRKQVMDMHNQDLKRFEIPPELRHYSWYKSLVAHSKKFKHIVRRKIDDPMILLEMWQRVQDSADPMSLTREFNKVLMSHPRRSHSTRSDQPLIGHLASLYAGLYSSSGEPFVKVFEARATNWRRRPTLSQGKTLQQEAVVLRHGLVFPDALPSTHRRTLVRIQNALTLRRDAALKPVSLYLLLQQRLAESRETHAGNFERAQSIRDLNRHWNDAYAEALKITAHYEPPQSAKSATYSQWLGNLAVCYDYNYLRIGRAIVDSLSQDDSRVRVIPEHRSLRSASASEIKFALQIPEQTLRQSPAYYDKIKENQSVLIQKLASWQRQRQKSEWLTDHKPSKKRGLWKLAPHKARRSHSERAYMKPEARQQGGQSAGRRFRFSMWQSS